MTGVGDGAAVQLQAFAAPRSEGLWDEIRAEMLAELAETAGAKVSEGEGSFGPEVRGMLPARTPEGEQVTQPVRFVGIDGPRWFLRAVFLGRAAVEPDPNGCPAPAGAPDHRRARHLSDGVRATRSR